MKITTTEITDNNSLMKMIYTIASFVSLILALSANGLAQSTAYTDGKAAGLTSEQIDSLKELNAAIAVPTYIPKGFSLKEVNIEEPPAPEIVGYTLVYRNAAGKSFTIQSVNDGVGDVSVPQVYGRNRYFTNRIQAGYGMDGDTTLFVSWIESKKAYQPKGSLPQLYSLVSEKGDITLRDAVRIMESLRYLKK